MSNPPEPSPHAFIPPSLQKKLRISRRHSHRRRNRYKRKHIRLQGLVYQRILYLFEWADYIYSINPNLAHNAISIAREEAMGAKITIPRDLKRKICHGCKNYLKHGHNVRIRSHSRKGYGVWITKTCLDCGHITRYLNPKKE
jgi:ribonuclease P protein subunit RPR2